MLSPFICLFRYAIFLLCHDAADAAAYFDADYFLFAAF